MPGEADDDLLFDDAADFVAAQVTGKNAAFTDAHKLRLYGLYKQATSGKCTSKKPGIFDPSGRAKWDVWSKLGDLAPEQAKQQYVHNVASIVPDWQQQAEAAAAGGSGGAKKRGMGAVFSAFAYDDEENEAEGHADMPNACPLHEAAGAGDTDAVSALLAGGTEPDVRDDVGATALHFAADRGSLAVLEQLARAGADANARDEDGQTPLHYAALNGHREAFELLVRLGADPGAKDASGEAPKAPHG